MKKFKYKRNCPKCDQKDITNMFVKKGRFYLNIEKSAAEASRDLINRQCSICGYNWNEKV